MDKDARKLAQIRRFLEEAEEKIQAAKRVLFEQVYQEQAENLEVTHQGNTTVIEGVFNGEEMIDKDGRKFAVPQNYASKSKLIAGDNLKLTIAPDGTFIFKQIGPIERKRLIGKLSRSGEHWHILAEGKKYKCLPASVTYFKAKAGDKLTIIMPRTGEAEWAVIENVVNKGEEI